QIPPQQTPQIPPQQTPQIPPQPQPQEGYVPTWERVETAPSEAPSTSPAPSMGFSNPRMEMLNELQQKLARRRRMIEGLE
ncbi:MAG: hypothetical protein Q6356_006045, partial [Candidatus Wukongarchaeota archaeon]|nr:hypothetical protein [Candidatus Wukongarchaeota archaeon]